MHPTCPDLVEGFDPSDEAIAEIEAKGMAWYIRAYMEAFSQMGITGAG